ncbi:hypothetical protein [Acanthopleuribacter pedis]|uniref:Uncharacterized protein n=1 Tax=Acanthopleuribacter pedis TaxID=442870 RepID=A0A8J7PZK4_9BACT|nr:hypothetical protein [Acanthopleuribacter pedis]MBO1317632.1 hypothetical protein [Acanthopleuribacter pedis]
MTSLETRIEQAKKQLDDQVREVVNWHFDPEKGTPFWLKYAASLDFDPRDRIRGYDDLKLLGTFEDAWLRKTPVREWIPQGFAGRPVSVFETGGSTGVPKSRINIEDYRTDYELFSSTLSDEAFPKGADWLMVGPSGPRRLRLAIEHLAQHRGGICFMVDLDPRWVNKLIKAGKHTEFTAYRDHVVEQALVRLKTHKTIECLFTTPKLLEAICEKIDLADVGIKGIFCGGTEMNAQFHRFAKEELVPTIEFVPTYGNTLMGLACHKPYQNDGDYTITYYPPLPRAVFELVDPDQPDRRVAYGETGRVRLTTLTKEFFVPRFLERDEGERAEPTEWYPWDGVSNLRLFTRFSESVVVGVY